MLAYALSEAAQVQNRLLVHFIQQMARVKAQEQPFPHFFMEGAFPADIYDAMLKSLPATSCYRAMGKHHQNADGQHNRFELPLNPDAIAKLEPATRGLWQGVYDALQAPQLKQLVFRKLCDGLAYRFDVPREQVNKIAARPRTALMRETTGYSIAPHPDTRKKIVTMQFSLPRDNSQEELGTALYRRSLAVGDWLESPRGFHKVKQFPFRPNCVYGFSVLNCVGKKSWHGRELFPEALGERNSILHVYYDVKADIASYD
jgi:hypothetical protein